MTAPNMPAVRLRTPYDNLCAALGIIQSHILASDSCLSAEGMFGVGYMRTSNLEAACAMLEELAGLLEREEWEPPAAA